MSLVGNIVGHTVAAAGRAYDYATPGSGASAATNAGRAIYNPNVVLSNPTGIFTNSPAFTPVSAGGGTPSNVTQKGANNPGVDTSTDLSGATAGAGGNSLSPADTAYLDTQIGLLQGLLGQDSTTLRQGEQNLSDSYNQQVNQANKSRDRTLQDYGTQDQLNNQNETKQLGTIDTNSRVLNDSLKRILGLSAGADSSAYQITAPGAVARQASTQRNGVLQTDANNTAQIQTARDRATADFASLLTDLSNQRSQKEEQLKTGVLQNDQNVNKQIAGLQAQKASGQGVGYAGAMAAEQPYTAAVDNAQSSINSLFDQYRTPTFQTTAVNPQAVNLQDYSVDSGSIDPNAAGSAQDPTQTMGYYLANLKKDPNALAPAAA